MLAVALPRPVVQMIRIFGMAEYGVVHQLADSYLICSISA